MEILFFFKDFFLYFYFMCIGIFACLGVLLCEGVGSHGLGVPGGWNLPAVGAESQMKALWKSNPRSSLLSHHTNLDVPLTETLHCDIFIIAN